MPPLRLKLSLFPSPIGELHFSIVNLWIQINFIIQFPSPIGELHFSIWALILSIFVRIINFCPLSGSYISQLSVKLIHQHMINVISVPYRGATFLNRNTNYNNRKELVISVPYRGATFLNRAWELVKKSAMTDFRPLSGSYISQSNVLSEYVKNVNFRPLSGSYISQYKCMVYRLQVIIFPSPIGELHFSILLKNS